MKRYWHRKPLLIRKALPVPCAPLSRAGLFELAARDDVESRLIELSQGHWSLRQGPLSRRALPPLKRPGWTLLVQGIDLHSDAAHELLSRFRFVPDARLDDLMVSYASDGGGVGPHLDSYDVFLLQVQGRRKWQIAPPGDARWVQGLPLKILAEFRPVQEWVLEPGDMLYLPPGWGHQGTAVGSDCMTCSIGFRAPSAQELVAALCTRLADEVLDQDANDFMKAMAGNPTQLRGAAAGGLKVVQTAAQSRMRSALPSRYADPRQPATASSAEIPPALQAYAQQALLRALHSDGAVARALGCWLTEPKEQVWFEAPEYPAGAPLQAALLHAAQRGGLRLDRRSRMGYDATMIYLNGECFRAKGRDAALMRRLADQRRLDGARLKGLSPGARALVQDWLECGWLRTDAADAHS